jgi:DNA-binding NtrC family response regulator
MTGIVLCDDLIFTSKIVGTARAHGLQCFSTKTVADSLKLSQTHNAAAIIVDLETADLNIQEYVQHANANANSKVKVIGFGSHVNVQSLKAAKAAGCHEVMPRSQFVKMLETKITDWLSADGLSGDELSATQESSQV